MNAFEAAIEAGEIRLGKLAKPMLTPKKWAAFLLCDEHETLAYLFARQQIANDATFRGCAIYDMQVALLGTDAFRQTMATQRQYRNKDADLNANYFVCAILRYARELIKTGAADLPEDNQFATSPRPSSLNPYGLLNWKGNDE